MMRLLMAAGLLLACSCGDNMSAAPPPDPGGSGADAGVATTACLEASSELPRPPSGSLPCELLPPR